MISLTKTVIITIFFLLKDTATTVRYTYLHTLSLHDTLPIWIWRPLNNPARVGFSSFADENPRGFGLSQRDRSFDHYQDGVKYEKRPSVWVEPVGEWGRGAVQLVEIPTDDEIHDNLCAMWLPEADRTSTRLNSSP